MATVVKESEGSCRPEKGPLQERPGRGPMGKSASFIPGTGGGLFIGGDEKAPYSSLAAIILHPIHSSSLS